MNEPELTSSGFNVKVIVPVALIVLAIGAYVLGRMDGDRNGREAASYLTTQSFQKDAIKQGVAQYDAVTGGWRWKTPDEMPINLPKVEPASNPVKDEPTVITKAPLYEPSLFPTLPELPPEPIKPAPEKLDKKKK